MKRWHWLVSFAVLAAGLILSRIVSIQILEEPKDDNGRNV
jgi:hypothetical protein